jgi:asparagine synthase (glutamine-hydrolysing)
MCGIAGLLSFDGAAVDRTALTRMSEAMAARGPDGDGLWLGDDGRIGLAHRRLAIIAPDASGAQPMTSADGTLHISFNGEIYNHRELRAEMEQDGARFRTASDTEVLLQLYARLGPAMVTRLQGMFAFALWDDRRQGLLLARDPFGIKPLYYAVRPTGLAFASQVKALAGALPGGPGRPDPAGHVGFLLFGYVPEPHTLHLAIRALPAGSTLWVNRDGAGVPVTYFSVRETLLAARDSRTYGGAKHVRECVREALLESVRRHLVADVGIGLFLSAGADSATLLALATEAGGDGLHTLTLAFDEFHDTDDDEGPLAEQAAAAYRSRHQTHIISGEHFTESRARLLAAMDQPSIDGVNSYFVAEAAAAAGLRVALSGVGGDELFGGYPGFRQIPALARRLAPLRRVPGFGVLARRLTAPLTGRFIPPKVAGLLEYGATVADAYLLRRALFMPWELPGLMDVDLFRTGWAALQPRERLAADIAGLDDPWLGVMVLEMEWYLRSQLLRDADWAGMAHGVEIRTPLVDAGLFRALAPLLTGPCRPGKADLAAAAQPTLPAALLSRPKTGFSTPLESWLSGRQAPRGRRRAIGLRRWALAVGAALGVGC